MHTYFKLVYYARLSTILKVKNNGFTLVREIKPYMHTY